MTPSKIYEAVYVKLKSLELPERQADAIAKAAYEAALKLACNGQALGAKARKENQWTS